MSILKKTILYILATFSVVLSLGLIFYQPPVVQAADCAVTDAYFTGQNLWDPHTTNGALSFNYPSTSTTSNPTVTVTVNTSNCAGKSLGVEVVYDGYATNPTLSILKDRTFIVPASNNIEVVMIPTEEECDSSCTYFITVSLDGTELFGSKGKVGNGINKGYVLKYDCPNTGCSATPAWTIKSTNAVNVSPNCTIKTADWYIKKDVSPIKLRQVADPQLELTLNVEDCAGWDAEVKLTEVDTALDNTMFTKRYYLGAINGKAIVRIPLIAGELQCDDDDNPDCSVEASITPIKGTLANTVRRDTFTFDNYHLSYTCKTANKCSSTFEWQTGPKASVEGSLSEKKSAKSFNPSCKVASVNLDQYTGKDDYKNGTVVEDVFGKSTWFNQGARHELNVVTMTITTEHCEGQQIGVSMTGRAVGLGTGQVSGAELDGFTSNVGVLDKKSYTVPVSNTLWIKLVAGEESCRDYIGNAFSADCKFTVRVLTPIGDNVYDEFNSIDQPHGNLNYECHGDCDSDVLWEYAGDSLNAYPANTTSDPVELEDMGAENISPDCLDKATRKAIDGCYQLYSGFAEVLKGKFDNLNSLGDFINAIIALIIGIAGVITVGLIMWDGFTYWQAGKGGDTAAVGAVKGRIWKRLLGLLLLFTIYTILRTINPDLLNLTPRINPVELLTASQASLSSNDYTAITGEPLKSPSEYDALAKDVAKKYSSEYCALRVIIQNESGGNPNVVGQDENVRNAGIPSRVAFINSAKKYSGTEFTKSDALITQKGFCNDAAGCKGSIPNPSSKSLGLDWRFTKGIGLTQITFFPSDYDKFKDVGYVPPYTNKDNPPSRTFNFSTGKMTVTPSEVFKPEKNLEISAKLWNEGIKKCGTPEGAFYVYACGACDCSSNAFAKTEVAERTSQYNQCKKENP
jgi:hypothetical protein